MNKIGIRKVKVLQGMAKKVADDYGLEPEDLVILTVSLEKVIGDPVSYLLLKIEVPSASRVVDIDFFTIATLPPRLKAMAKEQRVQLGSGLIVVKTKCCPPSYEFESIGSSPEEILAHMEKVAREDGVDLGKAVKKAFSEGLPQSSTAEGEV